MTHKREVFKDEEGTYGTISDGDTPTFDEIVNFEVNERINKIKKGGKNMNKAILLLIPLLMMGTALATIDADTLEDNSLADIKKYVTDQDEGHNRHTKVLVDATIDYTDRRVDEVDRQVHKDLQKGDTRLWDYLKDNSGDWEGGDESYETHVTNYGGGGISMEKVIRYLFKTFIPILKLNFTTVQQNNYDRDRMDIIDARCQLPRNSTNKLIMHSAMVIKSQRLGKMIEYDGYLCDGDSRSCIKIL